MWGWLGLQPLNPHNLFSGPLESPTAELLMDAMTENTRPALRDSDYPLTTPVHEVMAERWCWKLSRADDRIVRQCLSA